MADWEQKLKTYYENDAEYAPEEKFLEKLKNLEALPKAAPKRRYYLLPIAALLTVAVTLGAGWRYLRPSLPSHAPMPKPAAELTAPAPEVSAPLPDQQPEPSVTPKPAPQPETPHSEPQITKPGGSTQAQRAEKPKPTTDAPTPNEPTPDDPIPVHPVPDDPTPVDPPIDDPPPDDPPIDDPPDDPPPDDPPPIYTEEENLPPVISASYQKEGSIELVILSNQSTGESITIDVTGCVGSQAVISQGGLSPDEVILSSIYFGSLNAFGVDISYTLYRFSDGSARADAQIVNEMNKEEKT